MNGTLKPAPTGCALQIVLYDGTLQRPVEAVWLMPGADQTLSAKEFTGDLLPIYWR